MLLTDLEVARIAGVSKTGAREEHMGVIGVGIPTVWSKHRDVEDEDERRFILETLRQEAMELLHQQHAIADKGARALAFGSTVLAGFAAYGVAGKTPGHELLLRALPAALALIAIELLQNFATEGAIAQTREAIEVAINENMRATALVYDGYVRNHKGVERTGLAVTGVFFLLYLVIVGLTQVPGPSKGSIDAACKLVMAARFATLLTFGGLVIVAARVILQPRWVRKKLRHMPITIPRSSQRNRL